MQSPSVIEVSRLTKRFGRVTAVNELTFSVGPREIVGFLGPNGAGKSTTMRILAGFLPASSGTARVVGYDVFHQSAEVRRRIGYMPENNPLPPDMRVREYLRFRAQLKGLQGDACRERVERVEEMCGLKDVSRRIIGTLSKGFRQRVGLADALVHDPPLLILDEPTIGLDPNQIRALRQLIKELAQRRSVLLSSHILPEVEMTCTRVLIIHRGRVRAEGTTTDLQGAVSDGNQVVAEILAPEAELRDCWETMPEISNFNLSACGGPYYRCALTPVNGTDLRDRVYEEVRARGWRLCELTFTRHSLEDIFVHLTRSERPED